MTELNERERYVDFLKTWFKDNPKTSWGKNELQAEFDKIEITWLRALAKAV